MEEGRRNLLVGLFVLVGLVAVCVLIVLFGRGPTWLVRGGTYPIHVRFDSVAGVRAGTLVTVKGIAIGRVEDVRLLPPGAPTAAELPGRPAAAPEMLIAQDVGVDVVLAIDNQYRIPEGSSAQTTEPMLGQGRPPIEILPGPPDAQPLKAGAVIKGRVQRALDGIFPSGVVNTFETTARQIGDAAEALTPVLDEMRDLLQKRSPTEVDRPGGLQGNLSTAIARLDATLRHFNEVLGDPTVKSQLRETVANVHTMSEKGKKVMGDLEAAAAEARETLSEGRKLVTKADQTLTNLDQRVGDLSRALLGSLDRADRFLDHLNAIGQQINSGHGTLGRLVMDAKLYEALAITAERLSLMVEEFRGLIAQWREGRIRVAL